MSYQRRLLLLTRFIVHRALLILLLTCPCLNVLYKLKEIKFNDDDGSGDIRLS